MSMPKVFDIEIKDINSEIVSAIENHAQNNIQYTLDGVFDFLKNRKDYNPQYKVFKEYFVVCWSGQEKKVKDEVFYSRVDIELVSEQVRLFFSALDEVSIEINNDAFTIIEYVNLGFQNQDKYVKLEETLIEFNNNVSYNITSKLLFKSPEYDKKELHHIYNSNLALLKKVEQHNTLTLQQETDLKNSPITFLICYFNGFTDAFSQLEKAKSIYKSYGKDVYELYKKSIRIYRKVKYN